MSSPREARLVRTFEQVDFDRFARLSGDANPIHVDPQFSARTRFGRPVAHGMLLVAILRTLVERLLPGRRVSELQVMFPAPTFTGEAMGFAATVSGVEADGMSIELEVRRLADGEVTCCGSCRTAP